MARAPTTARVLFTQLGATGQLLPGCVEFSTKSPLRHGFPGASSLLRAFSSLFRAPR